MLILEWTDDEIVVGGLIYSRRSGMLRSAREVLEAIVRDIVRPAFGEDFLFRKLLISSFPAGPGGGAWVLAANYLHRSPHDQIVFSWLSDMLSPEDDGPRGRLRIAIGRRSRSGFTPVGVWELMEGFRKPSGVFLSRPAVSAPDGGLYLPFWKVDPVSGMMSTPEADSRFQGIWSDGRITVPVFEFCAVHPDGRRVPLHPIGKFVSGRGNPGVVRRKGFLLWGDVGSGMALWFLHGRGDDEDVGSLELIDLSSMRRVWKIDRVFPDGAVSLPDGRWAARLESKECCHGTVVFGIRDAYVIRTVPETGPLEKDLPEIFPLSDGRWVVACAPWFTILNSLEEEAFVQAPLYPVLLDSGVLLLDGGDRVAAEPRRWVLPSTIRKQSRKFHLHSLHVRGTLSAAIDNLDADTGVLLIPSLAVIRARVEFLGKTWGVAIGDSGYLIAEGAPFRPARLIFLDSGGNRIAERVYGWLRYDHLDGIHFVSGLFMVIARTGGFSANPIRERVSMHVLLFSENGDPVFQASVPAPLGDYRIVEIDGSDGISHVLIVMEKYFPTTFFLTIHDRKEASMNFIS